MGRLDTERGPVLRVYEFDRYNGTVWQVDMLLSNGSFVAHPRCAFSFVAVQLLAPELNICAVLAFFIV